MFEGTSETEDLLKKFVSGIQSSKRPSDEVSESGKLASSKMINVDPKTDAALKVKFKENFG